MSGRAVLRWWWIVSVAVSSIACAKERPALEEQAGRFREAKQPCDAAGGSGSYGASDAFAGTLSVAVHDCGYALPSRVTISDDGRFMFVAQLQGRVYVYQKRDGRFVLQERLFHDLGELGVSNEAGLTGLALAPNFDVKVDDPVRRDVFLAYQVYVDGAVRNRIQRVTADFEEDELLARDAVEIFAPDEVSGQAHQIHQPVAFEYRGETHLLAPVGDGKLAHSSRDPRTTNGTVVMLKRTGEPPDDERPWPENPFVQAIGIRNVFGLELIPDYIDPRRGLLGMENGDLGSDRSWYAHLLPSETTQVWQTDLGAIGNDDSRGWRSVPDPTAAADAGGARNIVFHLYTPTISPTAVSLHPGSPGGAIPQSRANSASFVAAFYGRSATKDLGPGKNVQLLVLENLESGDLRATLTPMVERTPESFGLFHHPVGLDVDPESGDIYFSDIISGELYRIVLEAS